MKSLKLLASVVLLMGVSGFWWGKFPSKNEAISACEEWEKKGKVITYEREMTIGNAMIEFSRKNPEPSLIVGRNLTEEDIKHNQTKTKWLDDFDRYYATKPTITYKVRARECRVENETKQVLGFENKSISSGTWKHGDDREGKGEVVKRFRY